MKYDGETIYRTALGGVFVHNDLVDHVEVLEDRIEDLTGALLLCKELIQEEQYGTRHFNVLDAIEKVMGEKS